MYFSIVVAVFLCFGSVSSQTAAGEIDLLPTCGLDCMDEAVTTLGCDSTDYSCQCADKAGNGTSSLIVYASVCMESSCSEDNFNTTIQILTELCVIVQNSSTSASLSSTSVSETTSTTSITGRPTNNEHSVGSTHTTFQTSTTGVPTSNSEATQSSGFATTTNSTASQDEVQADGGLSSVSRAGIAVGISAFSLFIAIPIMRLSRKRSRQVHRPAQAGPQMTKHIKTISDFDSIAVTPYELEAAPIQPPRTSGIIDTRQHLSATSELSVCAHDIRPEVPQKNDGPKRDISGPVAEGDSSELRDSLALSRWYLSGIRDSQASSIESAHILDASKVYLQPLRLPPPIPVTSPPPNEEPLTQTPSSSSNLKPSQEDYLNPLRNSSPIWTASSLDSPRTFGGNRQSDLRSVMTPIANLWRSLPKTPDAETHDEKASLDEEAGGIQAQGDDDS